MLEGGSSKPEARRKKLEGRSWKEEAGSSKEEARRKKLEVLGS